MKCHFESWHLGAVDATHYVNIVFSGDERWGFETEYSDDYVCQGHISKYIDTHDVPGVTILEIEVKELP